MALSPAPFDLRTLPGLLPVPAWPPAAPCVPCLHALAAGPVPVYLLGLPAAPDPWLELLAAAASRERRDRAGRLRFPMDALRCLAAEALLRHALGELHGLPARAVTPAAEPGGKPRLPEWPGIHFNLSHSGSWVACAVHHGPVGIDVEAVRTRDPLPADRVMAPAELLRYSRMPAPAARDFFYRLWTLKESLLKAMGTGLNLDPRRIALDFDGPDPTGTLDGTPLAPWRLTELPMPGAAKAALCH